MINPSYIEFKVENKIFNVKIQYSNIKNLYFKIKNDSFILNVPKNIDIELVKSFAKQGVEKFYKKLLLLEDNKLYSINQKFLLLFGTKYFFDISKKNNKFILNVKNLKSFLISDDSNLTIENKIKFILKFYLEIYLKEAQKNFELKMNIPSHKISIRYKDTNWASNAVKKLSISYNSKLAHFDTKIIDYVIVHELAHHIHPNHSSKFWYFIQEYMPNWKTIKNYLNSNQVVLD